MPYQDLQTNWKKFIDLIDNLPNHQNEQINTLIKRYIEQNALILNEVFSCSIDTLNQLQKAKTANDVICMQARFTNEISKQLSLSAQRFLNASLGNIADYNEWLKTHCNLATE